MVKAIGGCLIVYASFMVGHAIGQLHGCMVKEMEEMLLFIQLFKGQIMYAGSSSRRYSPTVQSVSREMLVNG